MPEIIEKLSPPTRGGGGRGEKYPYDDWLDGQSRRFIKGEDFDGKPSSFITNIREAAKRRGLRVSTRQGPDWAEVQMAGKYVGRKPQEESTED